MHRGVAQHACSEAKPRQRTLRERQRNPLMRQPGCHGYVAHAAAVPRTVARNGGSRALRGRRGGAHACTRAVRAAALHHRGAGLPDRLAVHGLAVRRLLVRLGCGVAGLADDGDVVLLRRLRLHTPSHLSPQRRCRPTL